MPARPSSASSNVVLRTSEAAVASESRRLEVRRAAVVEPLARVELTASFLDRLAAIEAFLAQAPAAFDRLLDELRATVIPNLERFPKIGRRYLDHPPQSAEAMALLGALPAGAVERLREYLHGDYLMLYTVTARGDGVHLLSIRHHRELSFQFSRLWPR